MKKQVWLNLVTGEFSNSWKEEEMRKLVGDKIHDEVMQEQVQSANQDNWKLIEYECLNDPSFEFYGMMKIR
jgi:hypothetical protein